MNSTRTQIRPTQGNNLPALFEAFLLNKTWDGRARKTLEWYAYRIRHLRGWLDEQGITNADTLALRRYIDWCSQQGYAKASMAQVVGFLKILFGWLQREGQLSSNPAAQIAKVKLPKQFPHVFTAQQARLLLKQPKQRTWTGCRDYTMLLLLLDTGMRRGELLGLRLSDVNLYALQLRVRGKGSKDRTVPISRTAAKQLHRWLERRGDSPAEDALFLTRRGDPVGPRQFNATVRRHGARAGISGMRISPHTFRHTFATEYVRAGGDVFSLQAILGHEDLETCAIYTHMAGTAAQEQHRKFSPVENLLRGAGP